MHFHRLLARGGATIVLLMGHPIIVWSQAAAPRAMESTGAPPASAAVRGQEPLLELNGTRLRNARVPLPALPALAESGGWTLELWLTLFELTPGQTILESRDANKAGLTLLTAAQGALALEVNDGRHRATWQSPPASLRSRTLQHVAIMIDGRTKNVTLMIDGEIQRERGGPPAGWSGADRAAADPPRGALPAGTLRAPPSLPGRLKSLRIHGRCLSPGEAARNHRAERDAPVPRELPPAPPAIAPIMAPFPMAPLARPVFPARTYDIREYGAVADGRSPATPAIARAIAACTQAGGGRVLVPPGLWLTGAIHLRSNVELHLAAGAVLRFSTRPEDYLPVVFTRWAGFECYNYSPLIYARDCTNIAITGRGQLDGQGEAWWHWVTEQPRMAGVLMEAGRTGRPVARRVFGDPSQPLRPQFIAPIGCTNVLIEGIALNSGPFWTIQCIYCENVIIRDVTVNNYGPNNDGVDVDSCRNVLIEHCEFRTGDDGVALKSGLNEDGWRVGRPTENVVIRHCLMKEGHGILSIGSEMSGDVRNVYAHQCRARGTERGLRLKSARGRGGVVEGIWVEDMTWENLQAAAISLTTDYTAWAVTSTGRPPAFRHIQVRNLWCGGAAVAAEITGLAEQPITDVILDRVRIASATGLRATHVAGLKLVDCEIRPQTGPVVTLVHNQDAVIERLAAPADAGVLLRVEGADTRGIRFSPAAAAAARRIVLGPEVDRKQVLLD